MSAASPDQIKEAYDLGYNAAILAGAGGERWIAITEKLPEPCEPVLIYTDGPVSHPITVGSLGNDHHWYVQWKSTGTPLATFLEGITHWQPLPASPIEREE